MVGNIDNITFMAIFLSYWIIKRKWRWDIKLLLLAIIWIFLALVNFIEKENKTIPP